MRSQAIILALLLIHLAAPARAVDPVHFSFSVQVFSVDAGITEIAPGDFFEIAYTIDQSIPDQNSSIGAGTFPSLATAFSLAARPLNAGTWNPMGTFDLAGGNYVTNAFGDNFTFQVHGTGFASGGPGLTFFDLDLNWKWPVDITDSGLGDKFGQQFGVTFNPARGVLRASAIRFRTAGGEFHEAVILPETPASPATTISMASSTQPTTPSGAIPQPAPASSATTPRRASSAPPTSTSGKPTSAKPAAAAPQQTHSPPFPSQRLAPYCSRAYWGSARSDGRGHDSRAPTDIASYVLTGS